MDQPTKFDLATVGMRLQQELTPAGNEIPDEMKELLAKLKRADPSPQLSVDESQQRQPSAHE